MIEDRDRCARIVAARDARFDGWLFVGVTSTGVYCRPSCPARTPRPERMRFFTTAAGAVGAGFRACLRCRPDTTPGSPEWRGRGDLAARAMRLIADGAIEHEGVEGLARRLHVSSRHLHRTLVDEVGCGALALARAERARTARVLIETTDLPMARIAFAAGFGSLRQFNDTIRTVYARSPTQLRRARAGGAGAGAGRLSLRLPARAPLAPAPLIGHLVSRAIPGVEEVGAGRYRRVLGLTHGAGVVSVREVGPRTRLDLRLDDLRDLPAAVRAVRRLLDLDADPVAVDATLAEDPVLAPLVAASPGTRVPAAVDAMEAVTRVVVGQQVSVAAARTVLARIAATHGAALDAPDGSLRRRFPSPEILAACDPDLLPLPRARARALVAVAGAIARGDLHLDPGAAPDEARATVRALAGIGPWSAEMIAMRALGDPDAFPASDLGLRRAAAARGLSAIGRRAMSWRPWRAYAAQLLWNADSVSETRRSEDTAAARMTP